ncbi:MAG: hypothetical protein AB8G86_19435, partial [Saprospiraceae bacterium]
SLKGDCLKDVREKLNSDQNGLCAYCQRKFQSIIFIEHYIPRADEGRGKELELQYANFLGVCSGKYYVDKKTGKAILFCSVKRGSEPLTINPENQLDIDTLFYDDENRIKSTNQVYQEELDDILNLNFDDLCLDRQISFEEEINPILEMAIALGLTPIETFTKARNSVLARNPEFLGYLLYRLNELITFHSS